MQKKEFIKSIFKRLLSSILIVLVIISVIFVLIRLAPGDPSQKFISPELSIEHKKIVTHNFHLNEPIHIQYVNFIWNLLNGDLGISYDYNQPVIDVIFNTLPFTIKFSFIVFTFQFIISFTLAFLSMGLLGKRLDLIIKKITLFIYSVPIFVSALFFLLIFSVLLDWLPFSGVSSIYNDNLTGIEKFWDYLKHLILPVITLSLVFISIYYKYFRETIDPLYDASFIVHLKSNGISSNKLYFNHIFPNTINPILAVVGIDLGILLGGALITEVIFGLPGMGRLTYKAIFYSDYPLIIGCCFFSSILMLLSNLISDIVRSLIDKRNSKIILT